MNDQFMIKPSLFITCLLSVKERLAHCGIIEEIVILHKWHYQLYWLFIVYHLFIVFFFGNYSVSSFRGYQPFMNFFHQFNWLLAMTVLELHGMTQAIFHQHKYLFIHGASRFLTSNYERNHLWWGTLQYSVEPTYFVRWSTVQKTVAKYNTLHCGEVL